MIQVVATANDPYDARDKILQYKPDVMTCDVEVPKMNGIEFIRRLLPQYCIPIIVVSSISANVFDAIRSRAVDFVAKPDISSVYGVEQFIIDMIEKVKIASKAKVQIPVSLNETVPVNSSSLDGTTANTVIAMGASTGGTEAIFRILKKNSSTNLTVKEAASGGDYVQPGTVLIAPGDQHMKLLKIGNRYKVECFKGNKINGHCPSVDVLFESVAKVVDKDAIGIILTGMGYDGAKGLLAMKRKGARTIGQDEKSSVVYGMPKVAYDLGAVDKQTSLENIGNTLLKMLKN